MTIVSSETILSSFCLFYIRPSDFEAFLRSDVMSLGCITHDVVVVVCICSELHKRLCRYIHLAY